jgi:xanthine dehydrogenase accessory factor
MKGRYIDAVMAANAEGRSAALATDLTSGAQLFLDQGETEGDLELDEVSLGTMREALRADRNISLDTAQGRVFVQVFSPPRRCFVIGAVHIAQPLVPMLVACDYKPIVIDPRGAWATEARFPGVELSSEWPDEALERMKPDRASAVVALTHDPKIDDPALTHALARDCFYIGALGSRKTHARRIERLKQQGLSDADLSRIHAPIGLDIGAVSPAEIAVAIMAQITEKLREEADAEPAIKAAS